MWARCLLALCASTLSWAALAAQDEHQRRLAAELTVMAGDVRRITAGSETTLQQEGLRARLAGALSSLPLLLRRAGFEATAIPALRAALARRDWSTLHAGLSTLKRKHPLDLTTLMPLQTSAQRLALGAAIHRQACAACHDTPASETRLPAFNLFDQIKSMPPEEFIARLIAGVRGDKSTAYRNPFSDLEIGALAAYYATGQSAVTKPAASAPSR